MHPYLPLYIRSLNFSRTQLGALYSLLSAAGLVAFFPSGWFADRYGKKWILLIGGVVAASPPFLFVFSKTFPQLALVFIIWGLGSSIMAPSRSAIIADSTSRNGRATAYGIISTLSVPGWTLGPMIGGLVTGLWGLQANFWVVFTLFIIGTVLLLLVKEPKKTLDTEATTKNDKTTAGLSSVFSVPRELRKFLLASCAVSLFISFSGSVFQPILPVYLEETLFASSAQIGLFFTLAEVGRMAAQTPGGKLSDRTGRKLIIASSLLGNTIFIYLFSSFSQLYHATLLFTCYSFMTGFYSAPLRAFYMDHVPSSFRSRTSSIVSIASSIGRIIGPMLGGFISDSFDSMLLPFYASAILALSSASLTLIAISERERPER